MADQQVHPKSPYWYRLAEVLLGLASVVLAFVILANLDYQTSELVLLLSVALLFTAARMIATGEVRRRLAKLQAIGFIGGGGLALALALVVILQPDLSFETLIFLLSISLTIQGFGRILHSMKSRRPLWLRGSALATGVVTVALAAISLLVPGLAALTLVPLLAVIVLVNGIEMVVSGVHPTDRRQITLMKLVLFSAFYGLVLINWVDLFQNQVPAYHVWLILTYMAPFGVLIVFQGLEDWQLALSLGLLVSLMNDVGYYFMGNLLFGFQRPILPWLEGQLGFLGNQLLFTFQGGAFTIPVTSWLMGLSIYGRIAVVSVILYHWWRRPIKRGARI